MARRHELTDPQLPLEGALWRLFHEEDTRVLQAVPLAKGCRCNFDYIKSVISRFAPEERSEMVDEDGFISVDCEFCSSHYAIPLDSLDRGAAAADEDSHSPNV